jgi:hypothetical protein
MGFTLPNRQRRVPIPSRSHGACPRLSAATSSESRLETSASILLKLIKLYEEGRLHEAPDGSVDPAAVFTPVELRRAIAEIERSFTSSWRAGACRLSRLTMYDLEVWVVIISLCWFVPTNQGSSQAVHATCLRFRFS